MIIGMIKAHPTQDRDRELGSLAPSALLSGQHGHELGPPEWLGWVAVTGDPGGNLGEWHSITTFVL
jgi:hypothetical protein